ncbi:MAG: ABC transporter substrate-binding protein [Gemmatimonadaceae bacterium]|jgi:branched-chain amino acid transport system substrate-binding protein|nr:ABC transporter substrate-binding protein [Gemmatimonadaceae bacterium]
MPIAFPSPERRRAGRANLRTALLAASLLASAVACGRTESPELRIGIVVLSEGPLTPILGVPGRQGAELAVDEINAAGGVIVNGVAHRITLRVQPSASRPDAAASAVAALINIDSVDAVIAPLTSALAAPAAGVAQAANVLFIAPMASNPGVTEGREVAFRLAFTDAFQAELLANFAIDSLAIRRVAALADEASAYGQEIVRIFRTRFEARGGRVVAEERFASDAPTDFRPQLRRLLSQRPDALLLPNYIGYDSIQVRQARELGFTGRFLGSDSWDPGVLVDLPLARGTVVVANWDDRSPEPEARRFVAAFRKRFVVSPRTAAAATYDAVHLVAAAASRSAAHDGVTLARTLGTLGTHRGASAHFTFDGPGAPRRGAVVIEVLEGRDTLRLVTRQDD